MNSTPATMATGPRVVYAGISGVLHPSRSLYRLLHSREPEDDGHSEFEGVPVLESALTRWPDVRLVLTSTVPWKHGLSKTLEWLGPTLAARVDGFTYEDLTTKVRRGPRQRPMSDEDYWRCNKSDIVRAHVTWLQPSAWVAIDDESILWTEDERENHLVYVDGTTGLLASTAQDRLMTMLHTNFD
jgi:hypothetical protein